MIHPRTRPGAWIAWISIAWISAAIAVWIAACRHSTAVEQPPVADSTREATFPTLIGVAGRVWRQQINTIDDRGQIEPSVDASSLTLDDLLEISFPTSSSPNVASQTPPANKEAPHSVRVRWRTGTMLQASAITLENEQAAIEWPAARQNVQCSIDTLASIEYVAASARIPANDPRWRPAIDSDRLLARDGDRVISITGLVSQITREYVEIDVEGQARRVPREVLVSVIFAAPEVASAETAASKSATPGAGARRATRRLELQDGSIIETDSLVFGNSNWKADLTLGDQRPAGVPGNLSATRPPGSVIDLPGALVKRVEIRSRRVVWLSELAPHRVREQAVAGRPLAWRRDRSVVGGPIRLGGVEYRRGLGVRAPSQLEYNLPDQVETFVAMVGLDDAAQGRGVCEVAVMGDGPEPLWQASMRGGEAPRAIAIPMRGVRRLTLVVQPGPHLDLADFVDWADARLVKASPASAPGKTN